MRERTKMNIFYLFICCFIQFKQPFDDLVVSSRLVKDIDDGEDEDGEFEVGNVNGGREFNGAILTMEYITMH